MKFEQYRAYEETGILSLVSKPKHWKVSRVKDEFISLDYKRIPLSGEVRDKMIHPLYDYYGASGVIDKVDDYIFDEPLILIGEDGANLLLRGSPLAFIARGKYWVNNHAHVLKPKKGNLVYFSYLLESLDYTELVSGSAQPKLTASALNNVFLIVSPLSEQEEIAHYLDTKTAQIDRKIDLLTQKAQRYEELKRSLINETVTRGLDKSVPMKHSGIEWIGEIPEHWQARKIKKLANVKRGASPRPIDDPKYFDDLHGKYGWVRIEDVTRSSKYLLSTKDKLSTLGSSKSVKMKPGNIFLSIAGSVGKPIISQIDCCIHDGFVYFVDLKQNVDFMFYIFNCPNVFVGLGKVGTQLNLNTEIVGGISIPLPPLDEQKAIADYLDIKTAQIDQIIENINTQIDIQKELRKTLINDVVTGKIKVTDH